MGIDEEEAERIIDMRGKSTHSAWLTFMYPRLVLARELISDGNSPQNLDKFWRAIYYEINR